LDQAALRGAAPTAARDCASQGDRHRYPVARPAGARPPPAAARRHRALPPHVPVSRAALGEALQAVHPPGPTPVPARQDLPRLLRRGAAARSLGLLPFGEGLEANGKKQYFRVSLRRHQPPKPRPACGGARLKPQALAVRVGGNSIAQAAALTARELADWIAALTLPAFQSAVAAHILAELAARVAFVNDAGLGDPTLDRLTRTPSR